MEERYLKILYNIYHIRNLIKTWKLKEYPKLNKFNPEILYNKK